MSEIKTEQGVIFREPELSEQSIGEYITGCEEVAVRFHTITENIISAGKKPVVLIPSRGAVPIFLLAHQALKSLDEVHPLVDPSQTNYYPKRVFEFLSDGRIIQHNQSDESQVDVVLYPFTADVSYEKNGEEWLARKLRESCARAFLDLVSLGKEYPEDLGWYYFLMGKMQRELHDDQKLSPGEIVAELKNYQGVQNSQIVLIDTVISGRAAQDITGAFAALGHKVAPILAVDTRGGGHFQTQRRAEIERSMAWDFMGGQSPFVEFPLITEDKGAALLGVAAINFANFNRPAFFRDADLRFRSDFLPQSCIWTLPPGNLRQVYIDSFHTFLGICIKKAMGEEIPNMAEFQTQVGPLISSHGVASEKEVRLLVSKIDKGCVAKETSSHIVSITLTDRQAEDWAKEFANNLFKNTS